MRDQEVQNALMDLGWKVYVIWECETKKKELLEWKIQQIFKG